MLKNYFLEERNSASRVQTQEQGNSYSDVEFQDLLKNFEIYVFNKMEKNMFYLF